MGDTGTLWHRGPRLAFATVLTPEARFTQWTVRRDEDADGLVLEWHGVPHARLLDVRVVDLDGAWAVGGRTPDGSYEVWWVQRENCACHHSGPTPLRGVDREYLALLAGENPEIISPPD